MIWENCRGYGAGSEREVAGLCLQLDGTDLGGDDVECEELVDGTGVGEA